MINYKRKVGLLVSAGSTGIDLSNLRIHFKTSAPDADRPPTALIRVFNLKDATSKSIQKEFEAVSLQAGYENGNFGVIFKGSIKQVRRGRLSAVDTFLDIMAGDGDWWRAYGTVNKTLAAGSTPQQRANAVIEAAGPFEVKQGTVDIPLSAGTGGTLPRGKVLFGLGWQRLTDVTDSANATWFVQDGKINIVQRTGYLPGEVVVVNSRTGMVGVPEATNGGISVTTFLNPLIKLGRRLKIDNKSINTTVVREQGFPAYTDLSFPAKTADDGIYRALVVEHRGDNRGEEWFTDVTCLAIDASTAAGTSVAAA